MAKRNVIDFRIVNIPNDDAFKQLEEQGKVDPNAMYVSPDTSLKEKHITNCITEIPQDIKLEYSGNTITLKSGSTIYIPNGVGVFDKYTYTSDATLNIGAGVTAKLIVFINANTKNLAAQSENCFYSGDNPTISTSIAIWYDTTENKIKFSDDSGSTWKSPYAFPIAVITVSNGVVTSIDQVFNGFGYIGSTVFALPGVKGLTPDGRNADGTLKNRTITISAVSTTTDISGTTGGLWYTIDNNNITRVNLGVFTFSEDLNCFVNSNGQRFGFVIIDENSYRTNGRITSFNPKQVFRAVGYDDTGFIAHQAMPSDKFIDLTLGVSDTRYTAPADGYVVLKGNTTVADKAYGITNESNGMRTLIRVQSSGSSFGTYMPVSSQQQYSVKYEGELASGYTFRFVFANGAK